MTKVREHPTAKVWDAVTEIAVDGSMTGKIGVYPDGQAGRMTFDTADGQRWSVYLERHFMKDEDVEAT